MYCTVHSEFMCDIRTFEKQERTVLWGDRPCARFAMNRVEAVLASYSTVLVDS